MREKILRVADTLFYQQGYHQTGTNQLIKEAGVSKASFYANFPSKEDLAIAYVQESASRTINYIQSELNQHSDPYKRYLVFQKSVRCYLCETDFRGCHFGNIAREFPDSSAPVRAEVINFEKKYHALLRKTVKTLHADAPERFSKSGLSVKQVTDRYYLLLEGAISACANFHDEWPLDIAASAIRDLVKA